MHFCADCGQVLDVGGGHVVSGDPCPACGSKNVSVNAYAQTATVTTTVPSPGIQSLLNWSGLWLSIARERVASAYGARKLYPTNPSAALTEEFHSGLVAIAAAAFAVEAEQLRVPGPRPKPQSAPPTRAWKPNAGDRLGQLLVENGSLDATTAEALGRLFDLRNKSVHPRAKVESLAPHPVGTNTSPEIVAYNADIADELIRVAATVVAAISH